MTLASTTPCTLYVGGDNVVHFFMEVGKATEVYINLREMSRSKSKFHNQEKPYGEIAYISGPLETVAQELNCDQSNVSMWEKLREIVAFTGQKAAVAATPAPYREMLTAANNELLAKIEANKKKTGYTINKVEENVSNKDLFASIIGKYKGKALLVDFWATWCGPCRMANKSMIPLKEELKDKDIVYLYITGKTSPLNTWENIIPDIHGGHYRVTNEQWKYLADKFKVEGVPTYLIVDREGNIKFRQIGFPGVDKMKEELLKVSTD